MTLENLLTIRQLQPHAAEPVAMRGASHLLRVCNPLMFL